MVSHSISRRSTQRIASGVSPRLSSFLHEDRWGEVEEAAEAVRQQYTRELGRLNERNQEYNKLLSEEELLRDYELKEKEKFRRAKEELDEATARFNDATGRLQELGSGSEAEKQVSQLRELRTKLDAVKRTRERADVEIARLVGASRGIPFLLGALPSGRRILAQLQEENILPSDVSGTKRRARLADPSFSTKSPYLANSCGIGRSSFAGIEVVPNDAAGGRIQSRILGGQTESGQLINQSSLLRKSRKE